MEKENIWQNERISIKSVSDIVNKVPLEDIDNFITDLKNWYIMMKSVEMYNGLIKTNNEEMLWVNDWKNDHNVNITLKQDTNEEDYCEICWKETRFASFCWECWI